LLKTGSLHNVIQEFSMASLSWYVSHYTMLYKYDKRARNLFGYFYFSLV